MAAGEEPPSAVARLRDIEAVTDSALQHLDVDDLLVALLDRVLGILSCDTGAVLLLDEKGRQLVARAARGLEEEVRQGVRVPVGAGFAGRVAAERRPVILDRVDETTVTNPILWEKGIKALLGVPLVAGEHLLGVLHVGSLTERAFTPHDVNVLTMVAERVATSVERSLHDAERAAARALQRSLLPASPPDIPGFRLATRYVASVSAGVGGDWYDAFTLPSGQLWVVVGDVGGHGLNAAVIMGRLRSTLRSYALEGWPPEKVLAHTDRKLQHFEAGATATIVCAAFSPPFDRCELASAGHPPPILAAPGEPSRFVGLEPAPLLGAVEHLQPSTITIPMVPNAVLVLYTDGLVERRDQVLDAGLERLRATVWPDDPEMVCRQVMDSLIGRSVPEDDVAMLAIQRT